MPEFADIQEILQKLQHNDGHFPRGAVEAALSRREEMIPELLRILEHTADNLESVAADIHYMAPTYAMFLLGRFREPRAYPLLIRLFSTPGEAVMDLAGDLVTENLGNILASVSLGDMSGMASLVENPRVNEYVRSAALKGMVALVAAGERTRENVMSYFASLFHGRLEREPDYVWTSLVSRCVDLYPGEVYGDIEQLYDEGLVDSWVIRWEDVEEVHGMGKQAAMERLARSSYHLITNIVEEMCWWACFDKDAKKSRVRRVPSRLRRAVLQPVRLSAPKTGRNQTCPCGSGKKYKKCCGA